MEIQQHPLRKDNENLQCLHEDSAAGWADSRFVAEVFKKKLQAFVKWCLRYILKTWCPKKVTNTELWQVTGQSHADLEMRRKSGWLGHDLRKGYDEFPALP